MEPPPKRGLKPRELCEPREAWEPVLLSLPPIGIAAEGVDERMEMGVEDIVFVLYCAVVLLECVQE